MESNVQDSKLVVTRQFNATKEVVFDAFANAQSLAEWWGPVGHPITVVSFDFTTGGMFHYKMDANGQPMYGRFVYGQIQQPDVLEFTSSFSNEAGEIIRAPFSPVWPLEVFNRIEFTEADGKTTITMTGNPVNATAEEMAMFTNARPNLQQGLTGTLNQLEAFLQGK